LCSAYPFRAGGNKYAEQNYLTQIVLTHKCIDIFHICGKHLQSMHIYWNILLQFSKQWHSDLKRLKLVITWCDAFDNFTLNDIIKSPHLYMSRDLHLVTSPHQNILFRRVPLLLKITINMPKNRQYICAYFISTVVCHDIFLYLVCLS
jgi:hypothetical protein